MKREEGKRREVVDERNAERKIELTGRERLREAGG